MITASLAGIPGMTGTAVRLVAVALLPYFAWEMLQAPAFTGMPRDWPAATLACAMATLGDMVILILLYALGVGIFGAPPLLGVGVLVVLQPLLLVPLVF